MKYHVPYFCYKGKVFCYFWFDKKSKEPYIGFVDGQKMDHPLLEIGERKRIEVLRINQKEDIQVYLIKEILLIAKEVKTNKSKSVYKD